MFEHCNSELCGNLDDDDWRQRVAAEAAIDVFADKYNARVQALAGRPAREVRDDLDRAG